MKKFVVCLALAMMTVVMVCESATAGTIDVNQTLDLSTARVKQSNDLYFSGSPPFSGGYNVAIAAGDTFDFKIQFLPGQTITVTNLSEIQASSLSNPPGYVNSTGSFKFLDATGTPILTSNLRTDTEGANHMGQVFQASDFTTVPTTLTFSGVEYIGKLNYYFNTPITTSNYSDSTLNIQGTNVVISSPVPEPSTLALLGLGSLALAVSTSRRERVNGVSC